MPEHPITNAKNFVLENFSKTEQETVEKVLKESANAIRDVISIGIDKAMAKYN
jgi:peptidyl-tRNA hydrolase